MFRDKTLDNHIMKFGKYKNNSLIDIYFNDFEYLVWLYENTGIKLIKRYLDNDSGGEVSLEHKMFKYFADTFNGKVIKTRATSMTKALNKLNRKDIKRVRGYKI